MKLEPNDVDNVTFINPYVVFIERAGHNNIDKNFSAQNPKPLLLIQGIVADVKHVSLHTHTHTRTY